MAGSALCAVTGVDCSGGFELSIETVVQGLGYAVPPMMALLFILEVHTISIPLSTRRQTRSGWRTSPKLKTFSLLSQLP